MAATLPEFHGSRGCTDAQQWWDRATITLCNTGFETCASTRMFREAVKSLYARIGGTAAGWSRCKSWRAPPPPRLGSGDVFCWWKKNRLLGTHLCGARARLAWSFVQSLASQGIPSSNLATKKRKEQRKGRHNRTRIVSIYLSSIIAVRLSTILRAILDESPHIHATEPNWTTTQKYTPRHRFL